MAKTPPNTDPIVSDWLAANDDVYIPRNREKPVLTVLDGKEFAYLDYHSAVQMGKKLQAEGLRAIFQCDGSRNQAIPVLNRTQPGPILVASTEI